ncbi:MAG: hypothetical protein ACRDJ4_06825 [Actinomycetota bacterium]
MSQRLVTKKNRKVRRLRELYPDVKCKIFYQRDYLQLIAKYGLDDASSDEVVDFPKPRRRSGAAPSAIAKAGAGKQKTR